MGIQTNYQSRIDTREQLKQVEIQKSYLDQVDRYGGIKLELNKPQPRHDQPEPPPELKSIRERAPYTVNGQTIDPRRFDPDPKSPLGKLLGTVRGLEESNPNLHVNTWTCLEDLRDSYSMMKSSPDYDYMGYAGQLREKAQLLRDKAQDLYGEGQGSDISIGNEMDDIKLGPQMKAMMEQTAKELEDFAKSVETRQDLRPTMQMVGQFKSFETQAAINLVKEQLDKKYNELIKSEFGSPESEILDQQWKVLSDTLKELEERRDTFKGLNDDHPEWTEKEALERKPLDDVGGKKPGVIQGLLKKIGLGAWGEAFRNMKNFVKGGEEGSRMPPLTHPKIGESDMLSMFLERRLKEAGCTNESGRDLSSKDVKHLMHHEHCRTLGNDQNWDTIDSKFSQTINGQTKEFHSILTPQNQLSGSVGLEPGKGVCCHDSTSHLPCNVWQSELRDEQGDLMFRQIRTGVNDAYEIEDDTKRKQTNVGRCMQLVSMHVNSDPELLRQIEEQQKLPEDQRQPIVVRNLWVSHLTPDGMRGGKEDELRMSREQYEAMQTISGMDTLLMPVGNQLLDVKIKYEPIMFSFGVNEGAVGKPSDLTGGLSGGWDKANKEFNEPSMKLLLGEGGAKGGEIGGWVQQALDANRRKIEEAGDKMGTLSLDHDLETDPELRQQIQNQLDQLEQDISELRKSNERIEALSQQVQDLWTSGEYMSQGEDPYKMSSRLGVLGYEIGAAITSNCKSNKDRNSYGDVHMKDLVIQMHEKGELRAPNQPRSREEQQNLHMLTRESGNSRLQELNVGAPGYKLKGVDMVFTEQGTGTNDIEFLGVGPFTAT